MVCEIMAVHQCRCCCCLIKEKVALESNRMLRGLVNWFGDDDVRQRKYCPYVQGNEQRDARRPSPLNWIRLFVKRVLILSIGQKD
jgi:hypothetical protein